MQRAAADHLAVEFGDPEFLDRLVEGDEVLLQQNLSRIGVDEPFDARNVGRPGAADDDFATLVVPGRRPR